MHHYVVSLSGGLDSTVALTWVLEQAERAAVNDGPYKVYPYGFLYGQRHANEEYAARDIVKYLQKKYKHLEDYDLIDLNPITRLFDPTNSGALLNKDQEIPNAEYKDLKGVSPTYVPFRNGIFLSFLAGIAVSKIARDSDDLANVIIGSHRDDASGDAYPDCTEAFNRYIGEAIAKGTYEKVELWPIVWNKTKAEIVKIGNELKAPLHLTWSCYEGGKQHCGVCPTCRARKEAFMLACVEDPTEYAFSEEGEPGEF